MQVTKNKIATAIALILMLTMTVLMAGISSANAAGIDTRAIVMASPAVGVGQNLLVIAGLSMPPPGALVSPATPRWENLTVTITKPDGSSEIRSPLRSDSTGTLFFIYVPAVKGTYYFQCSFPGQTIAGVYYNPCTSEKLAVVVQEEPIPSWPAGGLPAEYWTRPIYSMNREWRSISGNWLGLGGGSHGVGSYGPDQNPFNPYTTAPNTAHIVWTKELTLGGLVGGEHYELGYYGGQPYEARFHPPIIINGRLYYNLYDVQRYQQYQGFTCVDLFTGETIWTREGTISKGNTINFPVVNQYGIVPPILWSTWDTTWRAYDAFTGDLLFSMVNVTSADTFAMDENGNLLAYIISRARAGANWLAMWNATKAMPWGTALNFRERAGTYDWRRGIEWNVTVPDVPGNPTFGNLDSLINPTVMICEAFIPETPANQVHTFVQVAYSLTDQRQLWVANRTDIGERSRRPNYRNIIGDGVFMVYHKEATRYHGYDIYTGKRLWLSDPYDTNDWAVFTRTVATAYGKLLSIGMDGYVVAFDTKTGKLLWKTNPSEGDLIDAPYGHNSFSTHSGYLIADGKIYAASGEHSPNQPLWRGGRLYALNVESGKVLWKILGWWDCGQPVIADGYLVGFNGYDNRLYSFGKGPSATTVSIQNDVTTHGNKVLVKGSVIDIAAGTKQKEQAARFPNGVPAVSDESMSAWMEYVYMQQPRPTNATGVEVTLDTVDPNGNFVHIGTVTTDSGGAYSYMWTPEVPGKYTVFATFAGSESYWPSYAETAIGVEEAPPATPPPQYPVPADYTLTIVAAAIAIIIAVAIVGIMIVRILRKRP